MDGAQAGQTGQVFVAVLTDDHSTPGCDLLAEQGDKILSAGGIEHGERFVEHQAVRLAGKDGCQGELLLLAAGEAAWSAGAELTETKALEGLVQAALHLGVLQAQVFQAEQDLFRNGGGEHLGGGILEDQPGAL